MWKSMINIVLGNFLSPLTVGGYELNFYQFISFYYLILRNRCT